MQSVREREHVSRRPRPPKNTQSRANKRNEQPGLLEVGIDYTLYISVIFLVLIGIVMVFSASYYVAVAIQGRSRFHYVRMQSIAAAIGFVLMFGLSKINYNFLKRWVALGYWFSIGLLVAVLIPGVGSAAGGAQRWLFIPGIPVGIQPSEIAKITGILMVSHVIATDPDKTMKTFMGLCKVGFYIVLPVALVGAQNLSTAIVITVIGFGIVFVASPYTMPFVLMGLSGVGAITAYLAFFAEGFRSARFAAWQDPFAYATTTGFQTVQSLFAIGSGGIFGLGLGQSRQKLGFIPEAHNDIIFSIIVEELGILGGAIILFLFGVFLWRALKIAIQSGDLFGSLVATGIAVMIGVQVLINVGVVTNAIPNTGVPLPFISYGGTSLSITVASMGILLSISRYREKSRTL